MCFVQIMNVKLFLFCFEELVEQLQVQNWYKTQKSTNNQTLFFELLEEIMDPSHILLL